MNFLKKGSWKLGVVATIVACLSVSCAVENSGVAYDDIYLDDTEINEQDEAFERQQELEKKQREERIRAYREAIERENRENNEDEVEEHHYNLEDTAFDIDDYYDYAYTARIRRFHSPTIIYNYYDDYYTDLCWYDSDPLLWGTSIYLGYRWWYPSSYYWGWSYYTWHRPFYWHHPWGWNYYYGWHSPHYWGYYHAPWYYNSWDRNSNFYNRPNYNMSRTPNNRNRNQETGFRYNNNTTGTV